MQQNSQNLIWIDLEMTGLNTISDHIIEIATVITDKNLDILEEGPIFAISQTKEVIDGMDEWNTKTHGESGLIKRTEESGVSLEYAEAQTIKFIEQHVPEGKSPMAGNSICQDRRFLHREMPKLEKYFHYRNLDVSTLKELAARLRPEIVTQFKKKDAHTAQADILESIAEMKFYRDNFLKVKEN